MLEVVARSAATCCAVAWVIAAVIAIGHRVGSQPVRLSRRRDASADIFAFLLRGIGSHADLLDDQRPPGAHDQRRKQQQNQTDGRNPQVPQHDRRKDRSSTNQRDRHQDQLRRQHRIDIGISGTGERLTAARVRQQLIAVQPIGKGFEQYQHADQADQLNPRRTTHRTGTAREPNATKDVVRQEIRYEDQEHRHERVAEHQPVERQLERIEAEVLTELRILDSEISAVHEQLDAHPVALRDNAGQQSNCRRNTDGYQSQP